MSDKEFMKLPSFYELIKGQIVSVLKLGDEIEFNFFSDDSSYTASTDGNVITLNTWSPLVIECNNRYEKYLANIGSGSHECGHILYTDFALLNPIRSSITNENYEFKYSNELASQSNYIRQNFIRDMLDLTNIIEDGYIEKCLKLEYPSEGILVKGLQTCNMVKYKCIYSLENYEHLISMGMETYSSAFVWLLQILCMGFELKDKPVGKVQNKIYEYIVKAQPYIERYINNESSHEKVISRLSEMVYELLMESPQPSLEDEESSTGENSDQGNSENQDNPSNDGNADSNKNSSNNQNSGESEKENADNSKSNIKVLTNPMPVGEGEANRHQKTVSDEDKQIENPDIVDQTDSLNREIGKKECEEYDEKESQENFRRTTSAISSPVKFTNSPKNKTKYSYYYKQIEKTSKLCQKKVKRILENRDFEESSTGYYFGNRFEPNSIYRNNGKYYSRKNIPSEKPDVVFEIIIDQSGSMEDYNKIEAAKKSAVLFDDISRSLDIPAHIFAHTTDCFSILINDLVPFNSKDENRYRIASIEPEWGNIDTEVLTMACEEISKRDEKNKVVIVISDGLPCSYETHKNYRGVAYKNDKRMDIESLELNACVRYWRKKGISIIGVAIDEVDVIKRIYEESVLDCTDLDKLPHQMVRIFQKYVLKE